MEAPKKEEIESAIAKRESKAVFRLRILVGLTLLLATVGVSVGVYYYTSVSEQVEFEEKFDSNADKVLESVGNAFDRSLEAMDAFVVNLIATAKLSNQTWPFVTIPDFCVRLAKTLSMSRGIAAAVSPLVLGNEREAWEQYSLANNGWLDECFMAQMNGMNDTFFGTVSTKRDVVEYINHGYGMPADEQPMYFPTWQSYPVTSEVFPPYNYDFWGAAFLSAQKAVETHQSSISQSFLIPDESDPEVLAFNSYAVSWYSNFLPPDRTIYEPLVDVYYVGHIKV
jgi:hypothetical protein